MFTISTRSSSFVESIDVNPLTACVDVVLQSGYSYSYENVSRRAILNLMFNKNMSLGFWTNENLFFNSGVTCYAS